MKNWNVVVLNPLVLFCNFWPKSIDFFLLHWNDKKLLVSTCFWLCEHTHTHTKSIMDMIYDKHLLLAMWTHTYTHKINNGHDLKKVLKKSHTCTACGQKWYCTKLYLTEVSLFFHFSNNLPNVNLCSTAFKIYDSLSWKLHFQVYAQNG